jgi:hypothetical protein
MILKHHLKKIDDDEPFALNLGYQPIPVWSLDNILNG